MIDLLLYLSRLFVLINHGEALQIQASKYDLFNKTYPLLGQNCRNKRNHIYLTNKQKCIEIQTKSNQCTSSIFIFHTVPFQTDTVYGSNCVLPKSDNRHK